MTAAVTENGYQQEFTYAPDYQRAKSELSQNGNALQTRYYMGDWEYNVNGNFYVYYIPGGDGLCAIAEHNPNATTPVTNLHYVYTDHLGSIIKTTDDAGNIEVEQNFDAWGRFRDPDSWTYSNTCHPTRPGYTVATPVMNICRSLR